MSRTTVGIGLVVIGLSMVVVGIVSLASSSDEEVVAAVSSSTVASTADTSTAVTTATLAPTTTPTTTTLPTTTTAATATTITTTSTTTTTTTLPPPSVAEFIVAYAAATESGDTEFLAGRLFPELTTIFGEALCRSWVEAEILELSDYELTGEVTGPFSRTLNVGDTTISVEQYYEAPVSFTFQGASFDAVATFVAIDGEIYWIGECR